MKDQEKQKKQYSDWTDFKSFLAVRMREEKLEREKAEQKVILKEVEKTVNGRELILDNLCY